MTQHAVVLPRQKTPALNFPLVGGGTWSLDAQTPEHFTMIVFYRGYHCPICKNQLHDLLSKKADFEAAGVNIVVASSNDEALAEKTDGRTRNFQRTWYLFGEIRWNIIFFIHPNNAFCTSTIFRHFGRSKICD